MNGIKSEVFAHLLTLVVMRNSSDLLLILVLAKAVSFLESQIDHSVAAITILHTLLTRVVLIKLTSLAKVFGSPGKSALGMFHQEEIKSHARFAS